MEPKVATDVALKKLISVLAHQVSNLADCDATDAHAAKIHVFKHRLSRQSNRLVHRSGTLKHLHQDVGAHVLPRHLSAKSCSLNRVVAFLVPAHPIVARDDPDL